jgi:hypothetical protein
MRSQLKPKVSILAVKKVAIRGQTLHLVQDQITNDADHNFQALENFGTVNCILHSLLAYHKLQALQ